MTEPSMTEPTLVRLIIATDWDAGFQLTPNAQSLDDVQPGGEYVTDCAPLQRSVAIHEVIIHDFTLTQIFLGEHKVKWQLDHYLSEGSERESSVEPVEWTGGEGRRYRIEPPLPVQAGQIVHLHLRNDADFPRKPKVAVLVRDACCPTCGSALKLRYQRDARDSDRPPCSDAWHDPPFAHSPRIARTLADGPDNTERLNEARAERETAIANARTYLRERDMACSQLLGMSGERDAERAISQQWEEKYNDVCDRMEMLGTAYEQEVKTSKEQCRQIADLQQLTRLTGTIEGTAMVAEDHPPTSTTPVELEYVNWRGDRRVRRIVIREFVFGTMPPWHPDPTWLIRATDIDKGEDRMFAMSGVRFWREKPCA